MLRKGVVKSFRILFSFLLIFSSLTIGQSEISHAAVVDHAVTVMAMDENGKDVIPLTVIAIEEGDTAFDVLEKAGKRHQVAITAEDFPSMGKYITGIGDAFQSDKYWWSFQVYGMLPDVGVSSYQVNDGENILFTLTDNFEPSVMTTVSAADKNGNAIIPKTEVTLMEGATAYDALQQAAANNNVDVDVSIDDTYFTFLNNIGNTKLDTNDFWNFAVNGEDASVGMVSYKLQPSDAIQLSVKSFENDTNDEENQDAEEPADEEDPVKPDVPDVTNNTVQTAIDGILSYMETNNIAFEVGNEWWVWGLANTNKGVPKSYVASVEKKLKELDGEVRNVFDLEKIIIGLSAAGKDATNIAGYNLVDKLVNHRHLENPSINMEIYALLAVDSGQYEVNQSFRDKLINSILAAELHDGGWALFGDKPSVDITGMVLAALAPYQNRSEVKEAIDRAVDYLSLAQDDTSGYFEEFNGGDSSESVSQVIIGLAANGIDPTGKPFTKDGGNLVAHLLKFQRANGGFSHLIDDEATMDMSTQQALLALLALQKYQNGDGSVYHFDLGIEQPKEPEKPKDEEQIPTLKPTNPTTPKEPLEDQSNQLELEKRNDLNETGQSKIDQLEQPKPESFNKHGEGNKLPTTATNIMNGIVVGLILLVLGCSVLYLKRKKAA